MKSIPNAILNRMLMLSGSFALLLIVGTIWSIVIRDAVSLYLTLAVVIFGALKLLGIYRDAKEKRYEVLEGLLLSSQYMPGRKRQELQLQCDEVMIELTILGRHSLSEGEQYRLYYQKRDDLGLHIPHVLKPGCVLLGIEKLSNSTCK